MADCAAECGLTWGEACGHSLDQLEELVGAHRRRRAREASRTLNLLRTAFAMDGEPYKAMQIDLLKEATRHE